MFLTVLSLPPSSISLIAVFPNLSAPIKEDSHFDGNLPRGEEARPMMFPMHSPSFTEEVAIDQT